MPYRYNPLPKQFDRVLDGSGAGVVETLTGDSGGAVGPDGAFNIDILSDDSSTNNNNGVTVIGSPGDNKLTVTLTNRIFGSGTTTDGVTPVQLFSFAAGGVAGTYTIFYKIAAFNSTDNLSAGYVSQNVIRTTGAAITGVSGQPSLIGEEGTMQNVSIIYGSTGNNLTLEVVGLAGKTIKWVVLGEYVFAS